jgi:hypothetical protein
MSSDTDKDPGRCDWCHDILDGNSSQCTDCGALLCAIDSCFDGRCPEHTNIYRSGEVEA